MLRSYLIVALRAIRKHTTHAAINVVGLALGLAVCLLIALYVRHEMAYDQFHTEADRIHQVLTVDTHENGAQRRLAPTPIPLADALRGAFPQIEHLARLVERSGVVKSRDDAFEDDVLYADPAFFQMFSFPLVHGDPATALDAPNNVVLTTNNAERYFGTTDAVGRRLTIRLNGTVHTFTVRGVVEPAPRTSSIPLGIVVPFAKLEQIDDTFGNPDWRTLSPLVYVQLRRADPVNTWKEQLADFIDTHVSEDASAATSLDLLPLTDVHLTPNVYGQLEPTSRPLYAYILAGIAAFILLIACINFVTLAVGRSTERAREVGVRKTMGAGRWQVMAQFWGEALLLCAAALLLGLGVARLALPIFNDLVDKQLAADALLRPDMALVLIGLLGVVGLAAGGYPAAVLSRFQPVAVLRGQLPGGRPSRLVQGLVVVQFVLSIGLIAGTLVMWQQMDLLRTKDLGFQHEHVVQIDANLAQGQHRQLLERYRQLATSAPSVQHVTGAWGDIAVDDALPNRFDTRSGDQEVQAHAWRTHHDVVETLGLTLKTGRDFSPEHGADAAGETVLVNEALVQAFGWDDPIGKTLSVQHNVQDAAVVGVVEDFHFQSLRQEIGPLVLHMGPIAPANQLFARIAPGQTAEALDQLRTVWVETAPDLPFSFTFLDAAIEQQYRTDARWARIVTYAAGFALFIAGLGLFGLAALAVRQRTKEIGVRKVLGASAAHIVALLSTDFARLVGIAFVVAAPVAYWAARRWLQDFAYRIDLGPWVFLGAGALACAVALLTVGTQALRAARLDPATTLRDE